MTLIAVIQCYDRVFNEWEHVMDALPAILIVDDNPSNLSFLFDLLDQAHFEVSISQDGAQALARAEKIQPDLILLDIMLPIMNGFEICHQLKQRDATRHIPVIFMTALSETANKVRGFELGAVDYISKPFQPEEVLARIKTHLHIQQLQRALQAKNEELAATLEREKELNQLKSRFIAMVSHEFKTPLTTILLSSNLLKRYSDRMSPEKRDYELHVIEKNVTHMNALLENVLTTSKMEAGKIQFRPEMTDIPQLCHTVRERFQAICETSHRIEFVTTSNPHHAFVDPRLLEYILANLLSNAIKYSPAGGTIIFEYAGNQQEICFQVKDQGIGIPAADLPLLFETFHRGENVGNIKGTGLGLSLVKQFVELHGGLITIASELQQGTTFTVVLPVRNGADASDSAHQG
jgi:two-component system, sensor histidine kinase and response regulator